MKDHPNKILGPISGSEGPDLFSAQLAAALGKQHHKKKGGKKSKKKMKKLKKQLLQQLEEVKYERRKVEKKIRRKKGGEKKMLKKQLRALEKELEQLKQHIFVMYLFQMSNDNQRKKSSWPETFISTLLKGLDMAFASKGGRPFKAQSSLALPAPRD